jgi:hypothetical protein
VSDREGDARTMEMVMRGIQRPRKNPARPSSRYTMVANFGTEMRLPRVVCNRAFIESSYGQI